MPNSNKELDDGIQRWLGSNIIPAVCGIAMTLASIIGWDVNDRVKLMQRQVSDLQVKLARVETALQFLVPANHTQVQVPEIK